MVEIVERFQDFIEIADHHRMGVYQVIEDGKSVEIRIRAGRYGYIGSYEPENPELKAALKYCEIKGFIKIRGIIRDEAFFTVPTVD